MGEPSKKAMDASEATLPPFVSHLPKRLGENIEG